MRNFYPRSPCGERPMMLSMAVIPILFLSTLSLRRATNGREKAPYRVWISIHALLAESDLTIMLYDTSSLLFLSTLSLRRATRVPLAEETAESISIHALLAESDAPSRRPCPHSRNFYPRSPCGERLLSLYTQQRHLPFLSTLSLRRATTLPGFLIGSINNFYPRSPCGERP